MFILIFFVQYGFLWLMMCEDGGRWQGRGDKIFRNSVPLVTFPFRFLPSPIFFKYLFNLSRYRCSVEKIGRKHRAFLDSRAHQFSAILATFRVSALRAVYMQMMWSWGHLGSWHWEDEDIGPLGQGMNQIFAKFIVFTFYWHSFSQPGVHTHHVQEEELQHPKGRRGGIPGAWANPQRGRGRRRSQWHLWGVWWLPLHQVFEVDVALEKHSIVQGDTQ